ncbi:suppressor of cytokine signaling 7-like isoform X2 [Amphiura filiformis]|uniref:suppressor of cytokine signaling 7-like isoform X2 n=1 Tax=Amphiura filiformis TaxID=82378 RepID=UPI003B228015
MLMNFEQNFSDDDSDTEPTHVRLEDVLGEDFFKDMKQKNEMRSRSLPRQPMRDHHSPLRKQRGGSVKNRLSSFFRMPRGRKRHSTLGFPDRPLPDVPPTRGANIFATAPRPHSSYVVRQMQPNPPTRAPDTNGVMLNGTIARPQSREELEKTRGEFATSLRRISEYGWYWGPMSWDDAEMRLENMPDGSFLVRDSSDDRHILSLSFRAQGSTHHTRIEHHNGKFSFWSQPSSHGSSSIVEFIEEAMQHSRNGRFLYFLRPRVPGFPPAPVQLLFPISRFQKARSLQHMCRFVIRRQVRLDHIDELPLPRRLRDYLKEGQYYTPDDIVH